MTLSKKLLATVALTLLGACSSSPSLPSLSGNSVNYAAGSNVGQTLSGRETSALYTVFLEAMENGAAGSAKSWQARGSSGTVTPGPQQVGNLRFDPDELLNFRPGLKLSRSFETDLGEFVLTRNSNIRYGPSTNDKAVEVLPSGTGVEVVGKVVDAPWMLVAVDGEIIGFIFEDLMVRRPGTELELAGGPTRRPHLCRTFDQTLRANGQSDRWSGIACDRGDGWVLQMPRPNAPTQLF